MTAIHVDNEIAFDKIIPSYNQHQLNMRQDSTKRSALHLAAIKCNKKMFDALLLAGANQQARDASQRTPLDYMIYHCQRQKVKVELGARVCPDLKNNLVIYYFLVSRHFRLDIPKGSYSEKLANELINNYDKYEQKSQK